jgi:RNA polymerase sigma factor (sigma-70 family)
MSLQLLPQQESSRLQLVHHLDGAHDLARWLIRDRNDAEDIVQDAYLRALRHFSAFRGENGRAWLLSIVRNCCYDYYRRNSTQYRGSAFDEELHANATEPNDPETRLIEQERAALLRNALTELPPAYRNVLILRELEELSYKEIAVTLKLPLGTVMSRLNRARVGLQKILVGQTASRNLVLNNSEGAIRR